MAKPMAFNAVFDLRCVSAGAHSESNLQDARNLIPREVMEKVSEAGFSGSSEYSVSWQPEEPIGQVNLASLHKLDRCLVRVSPDAEMTIQVKAVTNDPDSSSQEHLLATRWISAYPRFKSVLGVYRPIIAVIDTGTEIVHPDLKDNIWQNKNEIPGNGVDDDRNGYVDDVNGYDFILKTGDPNPKMNDVFFAHGTHIAGLVAGRSGNGVNGTGIHGQAIIMPLNVFGEDRSTHVSTLENAIRYAVDNGATIINLSIGGNEFSSSMLDTLRYATRKGAFIVAAAGNDSSEINPSSESARYKSPAIYGRKIQGMMTITSVDVRGGRLSGFANYGMFFVELAAPGALSSVSGEPVGLLSILPGGGVGRFAGTSMAAPLVSGAAAIIQSWLKANNRSSSPAIIENLLTEGSRRNDALTTVTRNGRVLDFQNLMDKLEGRKSPVIDGVRPLPAR